MTVHAWDNHFKTREEAVSEIEKDGFFLLEFDYLANPRDTIPHRHDYEGHFYVLEGFIELRDFDTGKVHRHGPGSKVVMMPGTNHCGVHGGYRGVIGLDVDPATIVPRKAS